MSTNCMPPDAMPPDTADWATVSRKFVKVRRGQEFYRRGYVDDVMTDGSGLWMALYGVLGRVLIWREPGFGVAHLYRSADGGRPRLDTGLSCLPGGQEESRIAGDRS